MDFLQLLSDLNDGEQNRYGEVEYKLSDSERIKLIQILSGHLKKGHNLTPEENEKLTSGIFWGLFGTLGMVESYLENFIPMINIPSVKKAFQNRFSRDLVLYSRIQYALNTLQNLSNLGLEIKDWKKLATEEIQKWPTEEQENPDTILFLKKLRSI